MIKSLKNRRSRYRTGLHKLYLPYYDALCEKLSAEWQPYCGLRSAEDQMQLFAKGRTIPPIGKGHIVTRALPWQSPHQYGCATDWIYWDLTTAKPIWLTANDFRWALFQGACAKVGLHAGDFGFGDKGHCELAIKVPWREVKTVFDEKGLNKVDLFLEENLVNRG